MADLSRALALLDEAVAAKNPDLAKALAKGASPAALAALAKAVGVKIPADLTAWFRWHDGTRGQTSFGPDDNWYTISTKEALAAWRFLGDPTEEVQKPWKRSWLPILANGAGDYVCLELDGGKLVEYHHDDAKRPAAAKSLGAWVAARTKAYQSAKAALKLTPPVTIIGFGKWTPLARLPTEAQLEKRPVGAAVCEQFKWQGIGALRWFVSVKVGADLWCTGAGVERDDAIKSLNEKLGKPFKYGWPVKTWDVAQGLAHHKKFFDSAGQSETQATLRAP